VKEYIEQANRERMVIVQIEDPEAMEDVDGISAVEGIDMIFFGPGDYSHAIGDAGNLNHPLVQEGYKRVAVAAQKHGKFAGTVGPATMLQSFVDMGYRYFNPAADVTALRQNFLDAGAIAAALTLP
jgi:4-hydroxy-2-oxoheptanedioate aldolase